MLKSYYKLEKHLISEYLLDIMESENVEAEEAIAIDALKLYSEENIDFADALLSLKAKNNVLLLTWDKRDFKNLNSKYYTPESIL